jgi:hypothetical protein
MAQNTSEHQRSAELPTCLTLGKSSVVSRAAKLLGCRLHRDRSPTSCRPNVGWPVLGLRPAGARRAEWLKRGMCTARTRNALRARPPMVAEVLPKRRYAPMKVLIGVDPHKASVAVAAIDQATGKLLERASFPQERAGLRTLEGWAKRFPERRPKRWRTPAVSADTWRGGWRAQASRWWTCRPSSRQGYGCSL